MTKSLLGRGAQNLDAGWRIIETPRPGVGLVIGTFAAAPYLHLALESWRRNYPGIPVLVSDDGSPNRAELAGLCESYGADFTSWRAKSTHVRPAGRTGSTKSRTPGHTGPTPTESGA